MLILLKRLLVCAEMRPPLLCLTAQVSKGLTKRAYILLKCPSVGLQVLTCKLTPMHYCAGPRVPQEKTDKQGPNNDPRFHEKVHSELTLVWNPYKVVLGSWGWAK